MGMFLAYLPMVYTFRNLFVCEGISYDGDFNNRDHFITSKLIKQGYRYHKLRKAFFLNFITDTQG